MWLLLHLSASTDVDHLGPSDAGAFAVRIHRQQYKMAVLPGFGNFQIIRISWIILSTVSESELYSDHYRGMLLFCFPSSCPGATWGRERGGHGHGRRGPTPRLKRRKAHQENNWLVQDQEVLYGKSMSAIAQFIEALFRRVQRSDKNLENSEHICVFKSYTRKYWHAHHPRLQ